MNHAAAAGAGQPVIAARGLRKQYRNKLALDGTTFNIEPGRIVGLIGPNGAGKTTALKAILGLTEFDGDLSVLGKDPRRQRIALDALAELRDMRTLRTLIARLLDPAEAIVAAAHKALVVLTCQDFGVASRRWEAWAEQVAGTHRVEWLIDALGHQDEALRALASEELKQLTQQYFGYHPALPKKDRDLSQRKYREWWEREGRAQFVSR